MHRVTPALSDSHRRHSALRIIACVEMSLNARLHAFPTDCVVFFPVGQIAALSEAARPVQAQRCRHARWLAAHPIRNQRKPRYSADW